MLVIGKLRLAITLQLVLTLGPCLSIAQDATTTNSAATVSSAAKGGTASTPQFQQRDMRYRIRAGDSFDITFELSPEFNQTAVTVQPDGFVTLRGVGDLKVDGQTMPELTQTLRMTYEKILHDPLISVVLKDFEKPYFVADGQIGHPGKYDLRGQVTLTQAIAMAGGFTENSKHSQVLLFRRVNDEWMSAQLINVKRMEKEGNLHEDPFLRPGDMLFVPKNAFSKFKQFIPSAGVNAFTKTY